MAAPEQAIMSLLLATSLSLAFFFAVLAITLSFKEEKARKELSEQDKFQKQKLFQISILKEIQDRIGYSLDVEEVIDVITGSLKHIFPYSTASSMIIKQNKVIFKTYVEEGVSHKFIEETKESMLASLNALLSVIPAKVDMEVLGLPLDDTSMSQASSYFHIPLVVNNQVVGLINISSTKPNLYKEDEMTILYQITAQASDALSRLREVLETEKGKLTSMIASLSDGVFMIDNERNVLIINDAAKRFLKFSSPSVTFFDILSCLPPQFDLDSLMERVKLTKTPSKEVEIKISDKILSLFITPVISSSDNKIIGMSFLLQDITLQKSLSQLKEDFTNMMVHELRAPLTNIKDASSLMLETNLNADEKQQFVNMINSQARILLGQVSDLLDASKIEAGKFTVTKSESDLAKLTSEAVKTFLPQAEKKQVTISTKIGSLPPIELDPVRITQVINNLISNSLKFTNAGGKIQVLASQEGNFVRISVSDTGIGIPKDKQKDLFSKFYQVTKNSSTTMGTGLGLYLVKGVITAHNGSILLESEEGKGTTITFTLPITTQAFRSTFRTIN